MDDGLRAIEGSKSIRIAVNCFELLVKMLLDNFNFPIRLTIQTLSNDNSINNKYCLYLKKA